MPYRHNRVKHIDLQDILFLDSVVMKYLYAVFFALVFSGFVLPTAVAQTTMEKEIWKIDDNRQNEPVQEAPIEVSSKDKHKRLLFNISFLLQIDITKIKP